MKKKDNSIFNVEIKSSHSFICHTARKAMEVGVRVVISDSVENIV